MKKIRKLDESSEESGSSSSSESEDELEKKRKLRQKQSQQKLMSNRSTSLLSGNARLAPKTGSSGSVGTGSGLKKRCGVNID